jgi:hypothetical protein
MTRVNTLNEIADIYSGQLLNENEQVGKTPNKGELEDEKKASKSPTKDTGPEAAENYDSKVNEAGAAGKRDEKNHYSTGKSANESINTTDMSKKKSIFDKLYEDVLGGDDDELDMGMDLGDDESDEFGDEEGGDEVTVSMPRDVAQQLVDMLQAELGDEDIEDIEDTEDDMEDYGDDDSDSGMFQEGPDVQHLGDAGPKGSDLDKGNLKGKNNKVPGSGPAHKSGGGGSGNGALKGGKAEPSELGDKSGALTGKNNKVPGKVRGKAQELFD